jgi:non-ribosomal peptide synthetase component E (peptide arylation enzyme)
VSHDFSRSLGELVMRSAKDRPGAIALTAGGETVTYAELARRCGSLAGQEGMDAGQGDGGPMIRCTGSCKSLLICAAAPLRRA